VGPGERYQVNEMNYWWDMHAYQQSNKISPPSATDCTRLVSVMIASMSTMA
jgi:hypothetical protein